MFPLGRQVLKNKDVVLIKYLEAKGDVEKNWVDSYFYWICEPKKHLLTGYKVVGQCDLRFGYNRQLYFGGNIGYRIEKRYRGHHMAQKACVLLFEEAKRHHLPYVIITCNPDNLPSKRTLENLDGDLLEVVDLPEDNDMYKNGERQKCIFHFPLKEGAYRFLYADKNRDEIPGGTRFPG